jgi:hypothetical protein
MHKLAVVAALASCALPYAPLDDPPPAAPSDAAVDADAPAVIAAPLPVARPPLAVSALHGAPLRALAVSEDGAVAVSADQHGSVRLWPSLDGTHEPVVVAARAAIGLAIVHDDQGVAVAAIDDVGQLEIVRLGALGEPNARVLPELARPVVEVRALDHAFLARCDDGAIVRIGADGTRVGELRPGAHQHVTALAVRRGAALAIIDAGGEIRGRWIDVATMRWGKATPPLAIDGTHVELAPGHHAIAAAAEGGKELRVIEVTTGTLVYSPVAVNFVDPRLRPVGFQTDDVLAVTRGGGVWWRSQSYETGENSAFAAGAAAVGDAGVVAETEGGLVLQDAATMESEYLGYQLASPSRLRALDGGGWLATDGKTIAAIDGGLHTTRAYDLAEVSGFKYGFADVRFVDDRHAIAFGYATPGEDIYFFALDHGTATRVAATLGLIYYDADRRVLEYRVKDAIAFARYDAKAETFGPEASLHIDGNSWTVRFLDPSKSPDLAVAVDATYAYDHTTTATITRIRAIRDNGTLDIRSVRHVELAGAWWRTNGNLETLVGAAQALATPVRPSPDGTLVAELIGERVTLRDARGAERWTANAAGATDLVWNHDGVLAGIGAGMARFDVATGEVTALQCGWRFGRWKRPVTPGAATMCEQSWSVAE